MKDGVEMRKEELSRDKVREYYKKTMIESEKKNKIEEYKYCLNQNGQLQ